MHVAPRRLAGALLFLIASAAAAPGELIALDWGPEGRFAREVRVAPGSFVEVCGRLPAEARVGWRFEAGHALDFNIHYHEGEDVRYPTRQKAVARAAGRFVAPVPQDYCWMWTNRSATEAALSFTLQKP